MRKMASVRLCLCVDTRRKITFSGLLAFRGENRFPLPFVFCFVPAFWGILRGLYHLLTRQLDKKKDGWPSVGKPEPTKP